MLINFCVPGLFKLFSVHLWTTSKYKCYITEKWWCRTCTLPSRHPQQSGPTSLQVLQGLCHLYSGLFAIGTKNSVKWCVESDIGDTSFELITLSTLKYFHSNFNDSFILFQLKWIIILIMGRITMSWSRNFAISDFYSEVKNKYMIYIKMISLNIKYYNE